MQELLDLIKELKIAPEQLQELASVAQQNPFAAMSKVAELGIPPEALQKIMMAVMANPASLLELAKGFGADESMLKQVENGMNMLKSKD